MASGVYDLCERYVVGLAALDPVAGTMAGVTGTTGGGTDYGPDGYAARADLTRSTLAALDGTPSTGPADDAAARFLRGQLRAELDWHDTGEPLRLLRAPFGVLAAVRDSVDLLPRTGPEERAAVAERLAAVPAMLASWRASLAAGLDRGLPAARRQALESADQADRYAAGATHDALAREADLDPGLAAAAHAAYAETAGWLRTAYAPRAAEADAVGPERHALARRLVLGADLDPVESYEWAWDELHRISDELVAEAGRVAPGASVAEAVARLDETDVVVGLDAYRAWLQDQHDAAIERLDGVHFDIAPALRTVDVTLAVGSSSGSAYYTPPDETLTRPGRTWWPLGDRDRFAVWAEQTTVFHEGVPGHHLQLGQTRVLGDTLSRHQRVGMVPGHAEGWALYAERLADELGWFDTPGRRLGMLKGSALRAARVVIDIGLHLDLPLPPAEARRHGPRWTFAVATEVLAQRGGLPAHRLHPEMVRYCGWPAQATAYKLGERAWLAAREDARARPGFDLKRWHTAALALGPLHLADLPTALTTT